jgi:hypothetical protein
MFKWLKDILGIGPSVPEVIEAAIPAPEEKPVVETAPKSKTTKKKTTQKSVKTVTIDLNLQTKTELLAHAKAIGVKANASMKKADIISAIKNG